MQQKEKALYEAVIQQKGAKHQIAVALGELNELAAELAKVFRENEDNNHICDEIADVDIVLNQLKLIFDKDKIKMYKDFKLRRLELVYIKEGKA